MGFYNNHSIPLLLPQQYLSSEVVVESESVFCVQWEQDKTKAWHCLDAGSEA